MLVRALLKQPLTENFLLFYTKYRNRFVVHTIRKPRISLLILFNIRTAFVQFKSILDNIFHSKLITTINFLCKFIYPPYIEKGKH